MQLRLTNRRIIAVQGSDFLSMLHRICTSDVMNIKHNDARYGCMLSPKSRFLCDFFLYCISDSHFLIDVASEFVSVFCEQIKKYKMRTAFEIWLTDFIISCYIESFKITETIICSDTEKLKDDAMINSGKNHCIDLIPEQIKMKYTNLLLKINNFNDPRNSMLPSRKIVTQCADALQESGKVAECDIYNNLLIKHMIVDGRWLQYNKSFILEYNLDKLGAVSFNKGCYIGQELITRTKHTGVIRKTVVKIHILSNNLINIDSANILSANVDSITPHEAITLQGVKIGHIIVVDSLQEAGLALLYTSNINNIE